MANWSVQELPVIVVVELFIKTNSITAMLHHSQQQFHRHVAHNDNNWPTWCEGSSRT
jgi:hypothetical protein